MWVTNKRQARSGENTGLLSGSLPLSHIYFHAQISSGLTLDDTVGKSRLHEIMSSFSSSHLSLCHKHYSVPEICTLRILWPWTWCTAIVILISLVIRSICCCSESRLRTTFDRLSCCCHLYIWRLHSDRVILWKGKWTEQAFDGHNAHNMVINQRKRYLRLAWVHSYERD